MAAHQAPPSLGFPRQEHWSGLPFPSPMHESEKVKVKSLSRVRSLATPWTAAYQAPPSMGFSRQEYWSGVPLPSPAGMSKRQETKQWILLVSQLTALRECPGCGSTWGRQAKSWLISWAKDKVMKVWRDWPIDSSQNRYCIVDYWTTREFQKSSGGPPWGI